MSSNLDASTRLTVGRQAAADESVGQALAAVFNALLTERWLFLAISVIGAGISVVLAFTAPRFFVASTVLLPPQQQSAAAGTIAQLGALSGVAGAALGGKTSDELYVSLLRTRRLQDALVDRFKLQDRYQVPTRTEARLVLAGRVLIVAEKKTGLITVEVDDEDAAFAASLANGYVDELRKLLSKLAVIDAQQRRMFFEQQVAKTKAALNVAELAFRQAQVENGLVVSQSLAESGIRAGTELRSQIAAREVQLRALSQFATPQNADSRRVAAELSALRSQLARIEQGEGAPATQGGGHATLRGVAAVQAYRDMKVQEASMEILIKMLEAARLDESREGPLLQQVDVAMAPEWPTKPKRLRAVVSGAVVAVLVGAVIAICRAMLSRRRPHEAWGADGAQR